MYKHFNKICEFRKANPVIAGKQLKTNDPILLEVKTTLSSFKSELENKFSYFNEINFTIEVSEGIGVFPNILHICILPPGQKVSDGIYTAICFDKFGRGAVIGCAESKTTNKGLNTKKRTAKGKELAIDVDGGRPTTRYNDVFENPKEFYYDLSSDKELEIHISKSMDLCLYNLRLIEDPKYLQTNDFLNSIINEDKVEYFNFNAIEDDRKKIAIQINARRGQKKFREKLLEAYNNKCAVTNCPIIEILEAAHIYPYKGTDTNNIQNGLLLRSDIHTLFDLGFITINYLNLKIEINSNLENDEVYKDLAGIEMQRPNDTSASPSREALRYHNENIFIK